MGEETRQSGIDIVGDAPWGTHFCQFYQTRGDLIDILVPYFKAGLENNEFCMWVTSKPFIVEDAKAALKRGGNNVDNYIKKGQIEILDYDRWYTKSGKFEADEILDAWVEKENQALKRGFDGLRLAGSTFWLEQKDWKDFRDYEAAVDNIIGQYRMIALCSYSLDKCGVPEVIDVVANHQFALVRQDGNWELIHSVNRQRAEEALLKSREKYRTLFEASIDGILITDIETRTFIHANPALCKLLGYSEKEIKSLKMSDLHPKGKMDSVISEFEAHANGKKTSADNIPFVKKDGTIAYVDITGTPAFIDGKKCSIGFFRDVTGRKRTEEELRIKEKAIASSMNAIAFCDLEGKLAYVNDSFLRLWGYKEKEVLGEPAARFWKNKKKAQEVIDVLPRRQNWAGELTAKKKDGSLCDVQLSASMVRGEDGKPVCMMASFLDITERKRAEKQLSQRQAALELQTKAIEEVNIALKVLLKRREDDKAELEERVLSTVKRLVLPYAEKLKKSPLNAQQKAYLDRLELNLNSIVSPFAFISSKLVALTPTEIRVAGLVKDGKTAKEIAEFLCMSVRTVESHKKSIRRKFHIKNKKISLGSYLLSMST